MKYKPNEKGLYLETSRRYQTKRGQELANKRVLQLDEYKKLKAKLKEELIILDEIDKDKILARIKFLEISLGIKFEKVKKHNELLIPFCLDTRTWIFVEESKCETSKKLKNLSKKAIQERIETYKSLLHLKPANTPYWNPFAL